MNFNTKSENSKLFQTTQIPQMEKDIATVAGVREAFVRTHIPRVGEKLN